MSKLTVALQVLKKAAPLVKGAVVILNNELHSKEYKHKAKVDKVLSGMYKAADVVERVL